MQFSVIFLNLHDQSMTKLEKMPAPKAKMTRPLVMFGHALVMLFYPTVCIIIINEVKIFCIISL